MSFEINQTYHGFKLKRQETVEELKSLSLLFEHEGSGAQLLVLENDDDNKSFGIAFRTPPSDDSGVAHILEHSVLCGSRKYPLKEPFIELVKGSLQTFLNAMTYPDKTIYPIASRNIKDFYNLMDVYLDAVLYPRITEEIFMQEGWHYELNSPDEPITYKGVVLNEMKGVFSSPESLLERYHSHALFPATVYGKESGGDPEHIPTLTYDAFLKFHRNYYHPSNSRIFLYGDGDTLDHLRFLHEKYLKGFTRMEVDSSIAVQRRFRKPRRKLIYYPVSKEESLEKKTYVSVGLKLHKATDYEHCLGFNILNQILLNTAASPLRKALIDSGLGSEVIGDGFDDQRMETSFFVGLKGTEKEHEKTIVDLIFATLRGLVEKGIDANMIEAAMNTFEFRLREANFGGQPKGVIYNIHCLSSWLYDADPLMHLRYEDVLAKIKKAKAGYFEKLIARYLLDNNHCVVVVAVPKPSLAKRQEAKERKKLREVKSSLSSQEIQRLVETTKTLKKMQDAPDSPEALATLPRLGLEDINREAPSYPLEIKKANGPKILFHDLFTNKIIYNHVGFNTQAVPLDKIQYLPLLGRLILGMGTKKRDYVEMTQHIGIHTGGIRPSHFSMVPLADRNNIISHIFFYGKAVMGKLEELFYIYSELLTEYTFDNPKRLVEIIRSAKGNMEESILSHGNHYVMTRLQSYYSHFGGYEEITGGVTYYKFLEKLLEEAEKNPGAVAEKFREVAVLLFTRGNMLVNITSEAEDYPKLEEKINALAGLFPEKNDVAAELGINPALANEAFPTASAVQYVGKGANLYDLGFAYTGQFDVLKSILGTVYLWDKIRVQGGAYGSSCSFDRYTGDFGLVSYRDPNLTETLDAYDGICDFLEHADFSSDEMTKFIIGCVGQLDPPLTADQKGSVSMTEYLSGITQEIKQKRRDELLSTSLQDLKDYAPLFRKIKETGKICVLGGEEKIKKAKHLFEHTVKIFN